MNKKYLILFGFMILLAITMAFMLNNYLVDKQQNKLNDKVTDLSSGFIEQNESLSQIQVSQNMTQEEKQALNELINATIWRNNQLWKETQDLIDHSHRGGGGSSPTSGY